MTSDFGELNAFKIPFRLDPSSTDILVMRLVCNWSAFNDYLKRVSWSKPCPFCGCSSSYRLDKLCCLYHPTADRGNTSDE